MFDAVHLICKILILHVQHEKSQNYWASEQLCCQPRYAQNLQTISIPTYIHTVCLSPIFQENRLASYLTESYQNKSPPPYDI